MIQCKYYDDTYCLKCGCGFPERCFFTDADDEEAMENCGEYEKTDEEYVAR